MLCQHYQNEINLTLTGCWVFNSLRDKRIKVVKTGLKQTARLKSKLMRNSTCQPCLTLFHRTFHRLYIQAIKFGLDVKRGQTNRVRKKVVIAWPTLGYESKICISCVVFYYPAASAGCSSCFPLAMFVFPSFLTCQLRVMNVAYSLMDSWTKHWRCAFIIGGQSCFFRAE